MAKKIPVSNAAMRSIAAAIARAEKASPSDFVNGLIIAPRLQPHVNDADIASAIPNCPIRCVMALTIERVCGAIRVRVGYKKDGSISFTVGGWRFTYYNLPPSAIDCEYLLDSGQKYRINPFALDLKYGHMHKVGQSPHSNPKRAQRGVWKRKGLTSPRGVPRSRTLRREEEKRHLAALAAGVI